MFILQVAERQGRYLAKLLNTMDKTAIEDQEPFRYKSLGMLTYIGDYKALSELPGGGRLKGLCCVV